MRALVVYDSVFGNTKQVAEAIAVALGAGPDVTIARAGTLGQEDLAGLDLLVVGSPTQGFSATSVMKKWLASIPRNSLRAVKVAGFDTRADVQEMESRLLSGFVNLLGYAAKPIADQLVKKGGTQVVPPEGFFVTGKEGPLKEGELERAAGWARQILGKSLQGR